MGTGCWLRGSPPLPGLGHLLRRDGRLRQVRLRGRRDPRGAGAAPLRPGGAAPARAAAAAARVAHRAPGPGQGRSTGAAAPPGGAHRPRSRRVRLRHPGLVVLRGARAHRRVARGAGVLHLPGAGHAGRRAPRSRAADAAPGGRAGRGVVRHAAGPARGRRCPGRRRRRDHGVRLRGHLHRLHPRRRRRGAPGAAGGALRAGHERCRRRPGAPRPRLRGSTWGSARPGGSGSGASPWSARSWRC